MNKRKIPQARQTVSEYRSPVRAIRMSQNARQVDIARLAGLAQQTLSSIERGLFEPSVEVKRRIARALDVDPRLIFSNLD